MKITIQKSLLPGAANATPAVVRALKTLKTVKNGVLSFEKGEYHFYEEGCVCDFFAVSNNSAGEKQIAFLIEDFDGIYIEGNGSVFVFHGFVFPFIVSRSRSVRIEGITFDRCKPPVSQFTVCEQTEQGFLLRFNREDLPYTVENGGVIFQTERGSYSTLEHLISLHQVQVFGVRLLRAGDSAASVENLAAPLILTDAEARENGIYFRYRENTPCKCEYEEGEPLQAILDGDRQLDVIFLQESSSVTLCHLTVRRGLGMGIIGQLCENLEIDGFRTDASYHGDYSTLTADAMHFVNCSGNLNIHHCDVSYTMDDALNVHGIYTALERAERDGIYVRLKHYQQFFVNPYRYGDVLEIIEPKQLQIVAGYQVESSSLVGETGDLLYIRGEFLFGGDRVREGDFVENPDRMPNVHLHHNHFSYCPNVRVSGRGELLVEHNHVENSRSGLLAMDLAEYWYESGRVRHLVCRNNRFSNCNTLGGTKIIRIQVTPFADSEAPKIHETIEIRDNVFENVKETAITAGGVQNLIMQGNNFTNQTDRLIVIDGQIQ